MRVIQASALLMRNTRVHGCSRSLNSGSVDAGSVLSFASEPVLPFSGKTV